MNNKYWFTFVELIVVVTILWILSTLGFISYTSSLWDARDGTRASDIAAVSSTLKQYKQSRWNYPIPSPGNNFNIMVGSATWATQWFLDNNVKLPTLDDIPQDPKIKVFYTYSTTPNRQEYQVAATLENNDTPLSLLKWDFSSVAQNVLPTIVIAATGTTDVTSGSNDDLFVLDNQIHNLVYDFSGEDVPVSDSTPLAAMISEAVADGSFWQNSDYQTCNEIQEAGKSIWDMNYELVNPVTWELTSSWCTF